MKYSEAIKPISYLKAHASELIREVSESRQTMIITHNGEARVVLQDIHVYQDMLESLTMLKLLAQSSTSIDQGRFKPLRTAVDDLEQQRATNKKK
jgi:prevent-host-death family protein